MRKVIAKTITFIPKFEGNKNLPEGEQIKVVFQAPSLTHKSKAIAPTVAKYNMDQDGRFEGTEYEVELKDNFLAGSVLQPRIKNCEYEDEDGNVSIITSFDELLKAPVGFGPLLTEICKEAERLLKEYQVNEKNSE